MILSSSTVFILFPIFLHFFDKTNPPTVYVGGVGLHFPVNQIGGAAPAFAGGSAGAAVAAAADTFSAFAASVHMTDGKGQPDKQDAQDEDIDHVHYLCLPLCNEQYIFCVDTVCRIFRAGMAGRHVTATVRPRGR